MVIGSRQDIQRKAAKPAYVCWRSGVTKCISSSILGNDNASAAAGQVDSSRAFCIDNFRNQSSDFRIRTLRWQKEQSPSNSTMAFAVALELATVVDMGEPAG